MSVSAFSQTTSNYEPKVIKDSTGVTFIAFDSVQVNYIIQGLKEAEWNKKQVKALEKQVKNLKWKNYKQNVLIDTLNAQIKTYVEIKLNLEKQVSVKQKTIEELEKNIKDLETIEDNLTTIKEEQEKQIKKLKRHRWILIGTNAVTLITTILLLVR